MTESTDESSEAASLKALVTLTPEQATAAAIAAVPGTAGDVELENENGNVVYGVEVTTANGQVDVKVDPGNGSILAQEDDRNDGESADDTEAVDNNKSGADDHAVGETNDDSVSKP